MNLTRTCAIVAVLALAACTDPDTARRVLQAQGFRRLDIEFGGGCSDNDVYHTGFKARTGSGEIVTGVVCAGQLKGSTVRFD